MIVPTTKHYPPDTAAAIIWLKNRQPERWRDKIEQEVKVTKDVADYTDEELLEIATSGNRTSKKAGGKEKPDQVH
jgi:hypothetical protein